MNIGTVVVTAAFLAAFAQAAPQQYDLRFKPVNGTKTFYDLTWSIDGLEEETVYSALLTSEIVDVREDGSYLTASYQTDHKLKVGGEDKTSAAETFTAVTTYDRLGRPTAIGGDLATPESFRVANLTSFLAPSSPVSVGGSWSVRIRADEEQGTRDVRHEYRLVGFGKVGGRDAAMVDVSAAEAGGKLPASTKGRIWIDAENGEVLKYEVTVTNMPVGTYAVSGSVLIEKKADGS
ncbi:MAG: hypothetical protein IH945_07595 [Armatimonadetes bacterium]|nr:hypothetical protein [Armatimonadota bacterium]